MTISQPRIAIVDDDPFVATHLTQTILERLPGAEVVGITNPIAPVGFDVYIVDKEFGDADRGFELVRRVKAVAPGSLVIAYSAFLDKEFLRNLLSEACDAAFDKGSLEQLDEMIGLIVEFLDTSRAGARSQRGFKDTLSSITDLVREWNVRLAANGRAAPEYHRDG
jgi:DNA-binding LytR/AlgR family response regulator